MITGLWSSHYLLFSVAVSKIFHFTAVWPNGSTTVWKKKHLVFAWLFVGGLWYCALVFDSFLFFKIVFNNLGVLWNCSTVIVNYNILPNDVCNNSTNLTLCIYFSTIRNGKQCGTNKKRGWKLRRFVQPADGSIPKPWLKTTPAVLHNKIHIQTWETGAQPRQRMYSSGRKAKGETENTKTDEEMKRWTKDRKRWPSYSVYNSC